MSTQYYHWLDVSQINPRSFKCGHCGEYVSSQMGYRSNEHRHIYICHHCKQPTYFWQQIQVPGSLYGETVEGLDDVGVASMYEEARKAVGAGSPTAAVLCCRKLLMHVAVSKGAEPGATFASYVQFLCDNHYVPPDARSWVDHIREIGNEANHEIKVMVADDAKELIDFCEMLLKVVFEFPSIVKKKAAQKLPSTGGGSAPGGRS